MRKLIIIPTYNEAENIIDLVKTINKLNIDNLDLLIIDDNSPDNTAKLIKKIQPEHKNLYLLERPKKLGLGSAYINGFKYALARGYGVIIEMDADFSHDPKYLPAILKNINKYDFVIGSRYVAGGGISNWSFIRKLISRGGSLYARLILRVNIFDFTGGFNAWNAKVLTSLNLDTIKSEGYAFQIEMKYRAAKHKFSFLELPIIFSERRRGSSKMSKKIILEAMLVVWRLKLT